MGEQQLVCLARWMGFNGTELPTVEVNCDSSVSLYSSTERKWNSIIRWDRILWTEPKIKINKHFRLKGSNKSERKQEKMLFHISLHIKAYPRITLKRTHASYNNNNNNQIHNSRDFPQKNFDYFFYFLMFFFYSSILFVYIRKKKTICIANEIGCIIFVSSWPVYGLLCIYEPIQLQNEL